MNSQAQSRPTDALSECPHCQREVRVLAEWVRLRVRCPWCEQAFLVSSLRGGPGARAKRTPDRGTAILVSHVDSGGDASNSPDVPCGKSETPHAGGNRPGHGPRISELGRYRVVEELGAGAFGLVFLANDPVLRRDVAIKLPRFSKAKGFDPTERFRKEARAVARLRHPNIVSVFDHGQTSEGVYIVYEYVPGRTLDQVIRDSEFDLPQAIRCVATLAEALAYAASEGLVHRDIKPANIMLDVRDRPQIMDFGLAEALLGGKAATGGRIAGTPAYMSPEQARGDTHVGPASDQYSLAAILYEMLTGERSVTNRGAAAIIELAHRSSPPIQPLKRVPANLRAICLRAMNHDPTARYPDCHDFATDLHRFLQGYPVAARPVHLPTRLWMWSRRNVGTAVAALISTLLLLTVALVASGAAIALQRKQVELSAALGEAKRAREEAERNAEEATLQRGEAERQADRALRNERAAKTEQRRAEQALAKELEAKRLAEQAGSIALRASQDRAEALNQLSEVAGENRSLQYVETITAAAIAIRGEDTSDALQLLRSCESDRRGWEWHWLWRQATNLQIAGTSLQPLERADSELLRRLELPAGSHQAYDAALGSRATVADTDPPRFSFRPDGTAAVLASLQGGQSQPMALPARLPYWDGITGTTNDRFFPVAPPIIARYLDDGVHAVIIGKPMPSEQELRGQVDPAGDGATPEWSALVWNMSTDEMLLEVSAIDFIPSFAVLGTAGFVVAGTGESTLTVWRLSDGQQVSQAELTFSLHPGPDAIRALDDGRIVLVGRDHRFHYLDPRSVSLTSGPTHKPTLTRDQLCWSDDRFFVAAFEEKVNAASSPDDLPIGSWLLFDARRGQQIGTLTAPLSPPERHIHVDDYKRKRVDYRQRQLGITGLAVTPLRVGIRDTRGGVWCWMNSGQQAPGAQESEEPQDISPLKIDHPIRLCVANQRLLAAADDHRISFRLYRPGQWDVTRRIRHMHRVPIRVISGDSLGRRLASLDESGIIHVWDLENRRLKASPQVAKASQIAFVFSGRKLAVATTEGDVQIIDLSTEQRVRDHAAHVGNVTAMISIPSLESLVTAGADNRLRWWDLGTGTQVNQLEIYLPQPADRLAFHPAGIIAAAGGGALNLIDVAQGSLKKRVSTPLQSGLDYLGITPDGDRIVGASGDRVLLYDSESGRRVFELPATGDMIRSVSFEPDGTLVAILANGNLHRWRTN